MRIEKRICRKVGGGLVAITMIMKGVISVMKVSEDNKLLARIFQKIAIKHF